MERPPLRPGRGLDVAAGIAPDGHSLTFASQNAYPGYYSSVNLGVRNSGSYPMKVSGLQIMPAIPAAEVAVSLRGLAVGQEIAPGGVASGSLDILVGDAAQEGRTYVFTATIILTPSFSTPPPPVLKSPAGGSTAGSLTPRLEWYAPAGATSYCVQVATDPGFGNVVINKSGVTGTSYNAPSGKLKKNTRYYWRREGGQRLRGIGVVGGVVVQDAAVMCAVAGCGTGTVAGGQVENLTLRPDRPVRGAMDMTRGWVRSG